MQILQSFVSSEFNVISFFQMTKWREGKNKPFFGFFYVFDIYLILNRSKTEVVMTFF